MSKVSVSADSRLIDVCRYGFDAAASTFGSNDPAGTSWRVYKWLGGLGTFQVSRFSVLHLFTVDALDLEHYRYDLHPAALTPGSNDPIGSFRVISAWLHDSGVSQVSVSVCFRPINVSRFEFNTATSTPGSMDLPATLPRVYKWLHHSGMSTVSCFIFLSWIGADMLNLDIYRFNLDVATSTAGPMGPIAMFQGISAWFHRTGTHPVSCFDFMRLADFSRYGFDSSTSMAEPDESIQTFCGTGGWHGRHW